MGNVIFHVVNVGDLRGEEYWSQQPQNIVGNMDTLRGGWISSICKFSILKFFIFFTLVNVCIILIFIILTYIYWCIHVIIKERHPTTYRPEEVLPEQVSEERGAMLNGEQVNDPIEEDDQTDNVVEYDGTNTLIHDPFNVRIDDGDDDDNEKIDDFDDVHNIPLLDKPYEPLYKGSKTNLLSAVLFKMNLKVMNGLSNISITWMLMYVK